jgi:poly-gamma-glutamate capsule biosynthesis protein CapA/YwtB (metallophosphatase superfamily)
LKGITFILIPFFFFRAEEAKSSSFSQLSKGNFFSREVSLIFVGDVMVGRNVGNRMEEKGWVYPFEGTQKILSSADLTFGNLESPISDSGKKIDKLYTFRGNPKAMQGLNYAGFDILTLANNHVLDYGWPCLRQTLEILKKNGIICLGAGRNKKEALKPVTIELKNLKISFLSFNEIGTNCAKEKIPGTACAKEFEIIERIKQTKAFSDLLVISLHWGEEFTNFPNKNQIEFAHNCIEAGADLVVGHHPHVLQGIEMYKGKLIAYSLGNFVFDQNDWEAKVSIILKCTFKDEQLSWVEIIPIEQLSRPRASNIASGELAQKILKKVLFLSSPFNTAYLFFCDLGFIFPK